MDDCFYCTRPWDEHSLDDKKACAQAYIESWKRTKKRNYELLPVIYKREDKG